MFSKQPSLLGKQVAPKKKTGGHSTSIVTHNFSINMFQKEWEEV